MKINKEKNNSKKLLHLILESLENDKAVNIKSINLLDRSSIADYMVIASGSSTRQVNSMSQNLVKNLKNKGISARKPEGLANSDWVLIDVNEIIIHIFRPEVREFYKLEQMWEIPILKENKSKNLS
jgi:ribosome-associated protein|tara:strand:+ start:80 stop:457 length:378 start_codon:yes stop_codon:yes gene_type:complete